MGRAKIKEKQFELEQQFASKFFSCEKDTRSIVEKLFANNAYGDYLKRLLVINAKDCLDNKNSIQYSEKIKSMQIKDLMEQGYIRLSPKLSMAEHEEVKTYIIISYNNFQPTESNDYYYDCALTIDIICHCDYWDIGDFRVRPLKIAGYINGLLDGCRLSGIGQLEWLNMNEIVMSEEIAGYSLTYAATHGIDDTEKIDFKDMIEAEDD